MDISMSLVGDFILLQFYHSLFIDQERNRERTLNIMEAIVRDLRKWRLKGQLVLDRASFGRRHQRSSFRGPNNWDQMEIMPRN